MDDEKPTPPPQRPFAGRANRPSVLARPAAQPPVRLNVRLAPPAPPRHGIQIAPGPPLRHIQIAPAPPHVDIRIAPGGPPRQNPGPPHRQNIQVAPGPPQRPNIQIAPAPHRQNIQIAPGPPPRQNPGPPHRQHMQIAPAPPHVDIRTASGGPPRQNPGPPHRQNIQVAPGPRQNIHIAPARANARLAPMAPPQPVRYVQVRPGIQIGRGGANYQIGRAPGGHMRPPPARAPVQHRFPVATHAAMTLGEMIKVSDSPEDLAQKALEKPKNSICEFIDNMESYSPMIPDAVTEYFMQSAGLTTNDPRVIRLISLATQKHMADIIVDAAQMAKMEQPGLPPPPKRNSKEPKRVLTTELLDSALRERGIEVIRPEYHS